MSDLYDHRFSIQAWHRLGLVGLSTWKHEGEIAECDSAEAVGVALLTLTEDGEFHLRRKAAVWDREEGVYVGGIPW